MIEITDNDNDVILDVTQWIPKAHIDVETTKAGNERGIFRVDLVNTESDKRYTLEGQPLSRYVTYLGSNSEQLRYLSMVEKTTESGRKYMQYGSVKPSQKWLDENWNNVKFRHFRAAVSGDNVMRLTSERFKPIANSVIEAAIEKRFNAEGVNVATKSVEDGGKITYLLNEKIEGTDVKPSFTAINNNTGMEALKMYTGGVVAVCTNGMVFGDSIRKTKLNHSKEPERICNLIDRTITQLLSTFEEGLSHVEALRNMTLTEKEAEHIVMKLLPVPMHVRNAVWQRLFRQSEQTENGKQDWDGTMYGIYMASTYVATHETPRSSHGRVGLSKDESLILSNSQTYHMDWDAREKQLEKVAELRKIKVQGA